MWICRGDNERSWMVLRDSSILKPGRKWCTLVKTATKRCETCSIRASSRRDLVAQRTRRKIIGRRTSGNFLFQRGKNCLCSIWKKTITNKRCGRILSYLGTLTSWRHQTATIATLNMQSRTSQLMFIKKYNSKVMNLATQIHLFWVFWQDQLTRGEIERAATEAPGAEVCELHWKAQCAQTVCIWMRI